MSRAALEFGREMVSKYEARATEALRALKHRGKIKLSDVAKAAKIPESSMSRVYAGRQPVTLQMLDAIESITGESAVELLIDPHIELKAVNPSEATALRYFRSWPASTRQAFLTFASFFADEDPVTHDERRAHEQIRRLSDAKKRLVYGYLTFLTEGDLPRDVRIALGLPETDAPQSTPPEPPTRRRTTPKRP
jgi:transcriptional regulator with XRE-family HTH domain